jgi:hypothetical protein
VAETDEAGLFPPQKPAAPSRAEGNLHQNLPRGDGRRRLRAWALPVMALLLAAVVVLPPLISIKHLQRRIADSIGQGIGRPVRMSSVKMRLLPRPGFEITDFVVEEDPAFGAEPILRSAEVKAYVRLMSLWRGRLEIARIAFDEPSINLVRNAAGRWNFDSLISQAARIPKAPSSQPHAGNLPRFPYIDASNARVNFKIGNEKLPFSFFNADLAVWLENPGQWKVEFAAQPVRTDLSLDLANTGIVKIDGSLRRAATLTEMPAVLHAEWSNAALGQLSQLLAGSDLDWRGDLDLTADLNGSADHAELRVVAKGRGIHRIEFEPRQPLDVDVTCQAQFTRTGRSFDEITCLTPTGAGHLLLTGSVHGLASRPDPALSLEVNNLPVTMAFDGLRLVRSGFAPAAQAMGRIDGNFTYATSAGSPFPQLHGGVTVNDASIAVPSLTKPLDLPVLHLAMNTDAAAGNKRRGQTVHEKRQGTAAIAGPALLLAPFVIDSPGAAGLNMSGSFDHTGFSLHAAGESSMVQLMALGKDLSLPLNRELTFAAKGLADLDLMFHGPWVRPVVDLDHPVAPMSVDGSLNLHNAEVSAPFLAQPLEVASVQGEFANHQANWTASAIDYGPIHGDATLSYPMFCMGASTCVPRFTLHLASLDAAEAQSALLGAAHHGELVQSLIDRFGSAKGAWPTMSGSVTVGSLSMGSLTARDVSAAVDVDGNSAKIESLEGKALDGSISAVGTIAASGSSPQYAFTIKLERASASSVAGLFGEDWGPGAVNLSTNLRFSGFQSEQLLSSATGTFQFDWSKGGLPDAPPPLGHFDHWSAGGSIARNALTLAKSQVVSGNAALPLTGSISFARELRLSEVAGETGPAAISGTLQKPRVRRTATDQDAR